MKKSSVYKVMFLFHDTERNNGANHSMMDVIDNLKKTKKVHPIIVFPKYAGSAIDYAINQGYSVYTMRYGRWDFPVEIAGINKIKKYCKWCIKLVLTIPTYFKLKKIICEENVQVLYTNTYTLFLGGWLKKSCHVPHIWHIREFGKEDHNLKLMFGEKLFYKYLNMYSDKIIYISQSVQKKHCPYILNREKGVVLYNDISETLINQFHSNNKCNSELNLLIAGTLQPGKGQLEVIQAVEQLINKGIRIKLFIAGKKAGRYYEQLAEYVDNHKLNSIIHFCGYVEDMYSLRSKMDIGVVASTSEAFGRVTIEGMLSGLLMIGADAAGTSELIDDGITGFLYPLHDKNRLTEIIMEINNNRERLKTVAQAGFKNAVTNFTKGKTSFKILNIIEELCDR